MRTIATAGVRECRWRILISSSSVDVGVVIFAAAAAATTLVLVLVIPGPVDSFATIDRSLPALEQVVFVVALPLLIAEHVPAATLPIPLQLARAGPILVLVHAFLRRPRHPLVSLVVLCLLSLVLGLTSSASIAHVDVGVVVAPSALGVVNGGSILPLIAEGGGILFHDCPPVGRDDGALVLGVLGGPPPHERRPGHYLPSIAVVVVIVIRRLRVPSWLVPAPDQGALVGIGLRVWTTSQAPSQGHELQV